LSFVAQAAIADTCATIPALRVISPIRGDHHALDPAIHELSCLGADGLVVQQFTWGADLLREQLSAGRLW